MQRLEAMVETLLNKIEELEKSLNNKETLKHLDELVKEHRENNN